MPEDKALPPVTEKIRAFCSKQRCLPEQDALRRAQQGLSLNTYLTSFAPEWLTALLPARAMLFAGWDCGQPGLCMIAA